LGILIDMSVLPIEYVEGNIYIWEKPQRDSSGPKTLSESLITSLGIRNAELFLEPNPENDPFFEYASASALNFFSGRAGRLLISADYDVDGTTSAIILGRAFRALGWEVRVFIPDRFIDNYGVNYNRLHEIYEDWKYDYLIAADCGATELIGLEKLATEKGFRVAVVDHHKRGGVPESNLLQEVNPHMYIAQKPIINEGGYSTAIIAALLMKCAIEHFPVFKDIYPSVEILAGLSAMADSASMQAPAARYYASSFLENCRTDAAGHGIAALLAVAGISEKPTSTDVGFKIIPLINAAGRLRRADIILALLEEKNPTTARDIAEKLKVLNATRRSLQEEVQSQALSQYKQGDKVLLAYRKEWHAGVVGPAAGQLAELLGVPVFLGGYIPFKKSYSFSGRSGSGSDIHGLLKQTVGELPVQFGGHKVALGMKISEENIGCVEELNKRLEAIAPQLSKPVMKIKKVLRARSVNLANWNEILKLEPFGVDNPPPLFCIPRVTLNMTPMKNLPNSCSGTAVDDMGDRLPVLIFRNAKLGGTRKFFGHMVGEIVYSKDLREKILKFIVKDLIPA
jgi:single-stranded-DNA-specific exonuclease